MPTLKPEQGTRQNKQSGVDIKADSKRILSGLSSWGIATLDVVRDDKKDREQYQRKDTRHQNRSKGKTEIIEPARLVNDDIDYHKEKCIHNSSNETCNDGSG